jgi:hypothetical protein
MCKYMFIRLKYKSVYFNFEYQIVNNASGIQFYRPYSLILQVT